MIDSIKHLIFFIKEMLPFEKSASKNVGLTMTKIFGARQLVPKSPE